MTRIYHPNVPDSEHDHPDDEASLAVMYDAGWKPAPVAESDNPALAPEPVTYEPVKPAKSTRKSSSKSESTE